MKEGRERESELRREFLTLNEQRERDFKGRGGSLIFGVGVFEEFEGRVGEMQGRVEGLEREVVGGGLENFRK